ncbi:MAG: tetratricopeptide repeat protein [Bacteroidia bacterium]
MLYLKFNKCTHCLFYTFLFFYSIHFIHAQHNKSEALNSNEYSADTTKANELNHLSWALKFQKPDSSIALAEKALALINKYNHLNNTTHQIHLTRTYLNLGVFYHIQTNLPKALEYYHRSLKTAEKIANTRRVAMANNNIGLVYDEMKEYDKALNYYKKTLPFYETSNDYSGLAEVLKNCAIIYFKQHNYLESLKNSKKALEVTQKNEKLIVSPNQLYDNTITQAELLNNIGSCLIKTNNSVDSAYNYYLKALAINEKLKNNSGRSKTLCNIADIKIKKGDFDGAENNLIRAKDINSTVNDKIALLDLEKMFLNLYDTIAKIAYRKKDYSKAASHFHKAILNYKNIDELKDSVFSQENKKQIIQKELYYEFEKKEAQIKAENEKQQAIAHQKSRNKNIIITGAGIVVVLLILFSVFIFRSLKTTQHQKKLIELKNGELEIHRKIIEEKNKDITDSINYAQRIQKALLREEEHVSKHLPEHFIYAQRYSKWRFLLGSRKKTILVLCCCRLHWTWGSWRHYEHAWNFFFKRHYQC